jgi:trimethylamine--corrinoid protein Co-methyltransferase
LSQLVVVQLKNPGTPVIFGGMPGILDMKTTTYSYGAPELSLMIGALTELSHYYGLPMFGTAGATDARSIGAQMAAEVTYSCLLSLLTGADLVHDISLMYSATMESPELTVFADEVIGMLKAFMRGIEVNDETIPMDLIERVGPGGNFLSEAHTLQHFRKVWVPTIFDRSREMEKAKFCEDLLNEKTIKILETYEPKPLPEDTVKELKKVEAGWFKRLGIEHKYLKRE